MAKQANDRDFQNLVLGTILAAVAAVLIVSAVYLVIVGDWWALVPLCGIFIIGEIMKHAEAPKGEREIRASNKARGLCAANQKLALCQWNRRVR